MFILGHLLAGQRRLSVLKVRENFSSQIPSCWTYSNGNDQIHPPLPLVLPPINQRLSSFDNLWSVKQCPHCQMIWNRDVNACRYLNSI